MKVKAIKWEERLKQPYWRVEYEGGMRCFRKVKQGEPWRYELTGGEVSDESRINQLEGAAALHEFNGWEKGQWWELPG